jgi:2-amino-4-hydroxy-6-hydroxymethyldihydropteridine diphosphokinase
VRESVAVYVALGANLGDPVAGVRKAMDDIAALDGITLLKRSSLYRSAPLASSGPEYINAVVEVATRLSAPALLSALQRIEQQAGRERPYPNAPRTLDLDLLIYGSASIDSTALVVPHPRMFQRAFVLLPLFEIAPQCVTAAQLQSVKAQPIVRIGNVIAGSDPQSSAGVPLDPGSSPG